MPNDHGAETNGYYPPAVVSAERGRDWWNDFMRRAEAREMDEAEWREHIGQTDDMVEGFKIDFSGEEIQSNFAGFVFPFPVCFKGATISSIGDSLERHDKIDFSGAEFRKEVIFDSVKFCWADFSGAEFSDCVSFKESEFLFGADFSRADFKSSWADVDFRAISKGLVNLLGVKFAHNPQFDESILRNAIFGDIDETFTEFNSESAEQYYRTLKLIMGKQQARTEEAAFAAFELKSRRYRLKSEARTKKLGFQRFLSWAERCGYWIWEKCSDSGRSFLRPFALYLAFWGAFAASYVLPCQGWFGDWWTGVRYAFLKQLPFAAAFRGGPNRIGELEAKLFGANLPPGWVDALNSLQAIIALVLIFLMGLGIRHKFRLR